MADEVGQRLWGLAALTIPVLQAWQAKCLNIYHKHKLMLEN